MTDDAGAWLITDRLFETAARHPDRTLIIDPRFGRFTYGDVAGQVERLAWALCERGVGSGDIVVLQLPNWAPFIVFHLALTVLGAVTVNIPVIFREREVGGILALTGAKSIVVPDDFRGFDFPAMGRDMSDDCPNLSHVFVVEGGAVEVVSAAAVVGAELDPGSGGRNQDDVQVVVESEHLNGDDRELDARCATVVSRAGTSGLEICQFRDREHRFSRQQFAQNTAGGPAQTEPQDSHL